METSMRKMSHLGVFLVGKNKILNIQPAPVNVGSGCESAETFRHIQTSIRIL